MRASRPVLRAHSEAHTEQQGAGAPGLLSAWPGVLPRHLHKLVAHLVGQVQSF